ncbi:MAG TPA: CaiB/BaiF CoA-transferase family protein [Acidimicrobiales bacterium]|nr:CaiB/BaiF CoA-transferase family protein [Acidimicrobiales bacterium]
MDKGPLDGIRIIELAGLGALPFGSLKLADMGASIVRVERVSDVPGDRTPRRHSAWDRGRQSIAVDLKNPAGVETVLRLAATADVFLESFRPGVTERLGLGPDDVMARNPRIVYGRLTGWGQQGPLAPTAGHSLNYEAITGVIRAIGPAGGPPVPLLQIIGDFAGGGLLMAYGVVCALLEAQRSGKGQVVDAAMVDGTMSLLAPYYGMAQSGFHTDEMAANLFDGGAPFYNVYETADGKYVSVAPIEPHFYALLLDKMGLAGEELPGQNDRAQWPVLRARFAEVFLSKTRAEWCDLLEGTDACFAPVLTFSEARSYPHHVERGAFVDDRPEVAIAPRLSRTPGDPRAPSPAYPGADTDAVLTDYGFSSSEIADLRARGAIS